jgi:hypothetical protein
MFAYVLRPALQRECVPRLLVMIYRMLHLVPPAAHVPADDAHPQVLRCAAVVADGVGRLLLHVPADLGADNMQFQEKENDYRLMAEKITGIGRGPDLDPRSLCESVLRP